MQLRGQIESLLFQPAGNSSGLVVVLRMQPNDVNNGIEHVILKFQGREYIEGLQIGKILSVTGTLTDSAVADYNTFTKYPIMYNPKYDILSN